MAYDLESTIAQSAADKLVNSVKYPFTVFERKSPYEARSDGEFEGPAPDDELAYAFDDAQHSELLKLVSSLPARRYSRASRTQRTELAEETRRALDEIAANARECGEALAAYGNTTGTDKPDWDGPSRKELDDLLAVVEAETLDLGQLRKVLGDWGISPVITWIRIDLREAPVFKLGGSSVSLGIKIATDGTGEVWAKHPWFKCIKKWNGICYRWKKIVKHTLLIRVTLRGIKVRAKAKAEFSTRGAKVVVRGRFDELRIDHKYLDQIPIEKIANKALDDKPIEVFDAATLIATVPVLKSRFTIDKIGLPNTPGQISVQVTLRQV